MTTIQELLKTVEDDQGDISLEKLGIDSEAMYVELENLSVSVNLQVEPDSLYVNQKLVELREAKRRAQILHVRIQRATGLASTKLLNLETQHEILLNENLLKDNGSTSGTASQERLAKASSGLVVYKHAIREAKNTLSILKGLASSVSLCNKNIESANRDVKAQLTYLGAVLFNLKGSDAQSKKGTEHLKQTYKDLGELETLYDKSINTTGSSDTADVEVSLDSDAEDEEDADVLAAESASSANLESGTEDAAVEGQGYLSEGFASAPSRVEAAELTLAEQVDDVSLPPETKLMLGGAIDSSDDSIIEIDAGLTGLFSAPEALRQVETVSEGADLLSVLEAVSVETYDAKDSEQVAGLQETLGAQNGETLLGDSDDFFANVNFDDTDGEDSFSAEVQVPVPQQETLPSASQDIDSSASKNTHNTSLDDLVLSVEETPAKPPKSTHDAPAARKSKTERVEQSPPVKTVSPSKGEPESLDELFQSLGLID